MKPNFRIACFEGATIVELDGKTIGEGVKRVAFECNADGANHHPVSTVTIELDMNDFHFMEDGRFDECSKGEKEPTEKAQMIKDVFALRNHVQ